MNDRCQILLFFFGLVCIFPAIGCTENSKSIAEPDHKQTAIEVVDWIAINDICRRAKENKDWSLYSEAIGNAESIVAKYPEGVRENLNLGMIYVDATQFFYKKKDKNYYFKKAEQQFKKAILLNPELDRPYNDLARVKLMKGELPEAETYLMKALEINPDNLFATVDLGILFYNQKDYSKAEKFLKSYMDHPDAEKSSITYIRVAEFLGRIYLKQGRYEESERILKQSIQTYDDWLDENGNITYWGCPYQALGELYSKTGNLSKENESFLKAAELEMNRPWMQWEGALRSFLSGDYTRSLEFIHRLINLKDKPNYHLMEGLILLGLKRYEDAENIFRQWNEEAGAAVGFGHLALVRKDYPKAEKEFNKFLKSLKARAVSLRKILQKEKDFLLEFDWVCYEMAHLGLGWMHANQNQHEKALVDYEKILSVRPNHLLALLGKGNSLSGLKRMDEAEAVFNQTLKYYPGNKYAITELGIVKYNKGDYRSAEEDFKSALSKDAQNYTCPYEGMGLIYLQQGKTEEAKEYFEKAIKINPDIEYKKYNGLARIYIQEGDFEKAEALLIKSKTNYPYDPEADQLLKQIQELK